MSATVREQDMLKTRVAERDMSVTTFCNQHVRYPMRHLWTAVWSGEHVCLVWLHFWQGAVTPGGLAEAHAHIVEQVQRGVIPAQAQAEEADADEQLEADADEQLEAAADEQLEADADEQLEADADEQLEAAAE